MTAFLWIAYLEVVHVGLEVGEGDLGGLETSVFHQRSAGEVPSHSCSASFTIESADIVPAVIRELRGDVYNMTF